MSFEINLYKNKSEENALNKSLQSIATLSGTLRDSASILNPSILISANISSLTGCNYMYIPEFGRYYYITDIVSVNNTLVRINARVDVLMSFKNEILSNKALISRQETKWNLYLDDNIFKCYNNPNIYTYSFPNGFSTQHFVLAVAGG